MRDMETIDSELRLGDHLRQAARQRGGPLPLIDVADALLDQRCEVTERSQYLAGLRLLRARNAQQCLRWTRQRRRLLNDRHNQLAPHQSRCPADELQRAGRRDDGRCSAEARGG
jgi:hypothetical protein